MKSQKKREALRLEAFPVERGATARRGLCPLPPWAATLLDR